MIFYSTLFYILAVVTVLATVLAITRRNVVHAVVYLVISFFGTALLFYLLGAPFVALLEVIIYAGAIMVLFLFIIMMIRIPHSAQPWGTALKQWAPAIVMGGISVALAGFMIFGEPGTGMSLPRMMAGPLAFGQYLFQKYWFPVEIVSFLLLIALVGALFLGKDERKTKGSL